MADVKGTGEMMKQADAGMKLFKGEDSTEADVPAATAFKEEMDAKIAALEAESAALTGKDNKKARQEKDKEKTSIKNQKDYIDACKIIKGLPPVHGFFVKAAATSAAEPEPAAEAAPAAEPEAKAENDKKEKEKKEKPKKAQENAGLSRAEKDELESLKNQIIERKKTLKDGGMSGGQINKDAEIVAWVARMNELKEKENPGVLQAQKDEKKGGKKKQLNSDVQASLDAKQKALEEYTEKLRTEFKYSKKEIASDPDYMDMKAEIDKLLK